MIMDLLWIGLAVSAAWTLACILFVLIAIKRAIQDLEGTIEDRLSEIRDRLGRPRGATAWLPGRRSVQ